MTHTDLSFSFAYTFVFASCAIGFIFGMVNWFNIKDIDIKMEESTDKEENLIEKEKEKECNEMMIKTTKLIQDGAMTFLMAEYAFLGIFIAIFSIIILLTDKFRFFTVLAFILGAVTSTVSGFIGMYVATRTNARVTFKASQKDTATALKEAFRVALRGGCVMGFCLVSLALAVLTVLIMGYLYYLKPTNTKEFTSLFEFVAGYGLGGSTVALFCRVGGGIYTKAADVGADLVGKFF
jgi:inorganic pyrophosphatase